MAEAVTLYWGLLALFANDFSQECLFKEFVPRHAAWRSHGGTAVDSQREPPWPAFDKWQDSLGRQQVVRPDGVNVFAPSGAASPHEQH